MFTVIDLTEEEEEKKRTKAKVANRIENESVNIQIILCLTDEEYFIY